MKNNLTNSLFKIATLCSFFLLITGLVLFKSGYMSSMSTNISDASDDEYYYEYEMVSDTSKPNSKTKVVKKKKKKKRETFYGSKSGAVFEPDDKEVKPSKEVIVPSTKSARVFEPNEFKVDSVPKENSKQEKK